MNNFKAIQPLDFLQLIRHTHSMSDGYNLKAHLFICTNNKGDGKESCAQRGSIELRENMKKICQEEARGWHGHVRVNASGCLGRCKDGITAVLYPKGEWFTHLKKDDTQSLEKAIQSEIETS